MPLSALMSDMIVSRGRSDIYMWCTLALGVLQIVALATLWPQGIRVMVWTFVALNLLWVGVWFFFVRRLTGYQLLAFLKDITPFALAALGAMVATYFATRSIESLWLLLVCRVVMATVLYYLVLRVAGAKILKECQEFVIRRIKRDNEITLSRDNEPPNHLNPEIRTIL